jgi:predicted nucleic acid-binding protein
MICLDTNYLIRCLEPGSEESSKMEAWYRLGEPMVAPMLVWFEFICGPVTLEQEETARAFLADLLPFTEAEAREAARLFNAVGRRRSLRVDAMIAATALTAGASLATNNREDFAPFVPYGLELA